MMEAPINRFHFFCVVLTICSSYSGACKVRSEVLWKVRKGVWYGWKPSSSSNFSIWAFRVFTLIEIRQAVPCRAIRGDSISVSSTLLPFLKVAGGRPRLAAVGAALHGFICRQDIFLSLSLYTYIYIYIYTCICIYIYICMTIALVRIWVGKFPSFSFVALKGICQSSRRKCAAVEKQVWIVCVRLYVTIIWNVWYTDRHRGT